MSTPSPLFVIRVIAACLALAACRPASDARPATTDDPAEQDVASPPAPGQRLTAADPRGVAALGAIRVVAPEPGDPFAPPSADAESAGEPEITDGGDDDARFLTWGLTREDLAQIRGVVDAAAMERARLENAAGLKYHRKLELKAAMERYAAALSAWPGHPYANYNLACAHALRGERDLAVKHLAALTALGDETAAGRLRAARTDADFDSIRADADFVLITGYLPVHVAWSPALEDDSGARDVLGTLTKATVPGVDAGAWHQDLTATTLFVAKGDAAAAAVADEVEAALPFELKRIESVFLDLARPVVVVIGTAGVAPGGASGREAVPADFVGHRLTARTEEGEEHLTLKGTGFFSWEQILDNGTRVTRSGRYLLERGKLALDFRQVTETPTPGGGRPAVAVEQGRRTSHSLATESGALLVDGIRFEERR